jgi:hypothetical protein
MINTENNIALQHDNFKKWHALYIKSNNILQDIFCENNRGLHTHIPRA